MEITRTKEIEIDVRELWEDLHYSEKEELIKEYLQELSSKEIKELMDSIF